MKLINWDSVGLRKSGNAGKYSFVRASSQNSCDLLTTTYVTSVTKAMEVCEEASAEADNDYELAPVFQLSWEYIWLAEILPYLELEDQFRLRATCKAAHVLVNNHFASLKRLNIENKRNFSLEAFQVSLIFRFL